MTNSSNTPDRAEALAALAAAARPVAVSTADGEVRSGAGVADRVAAIRSRAADQGLTGSCPFTGWES